MTLNSIELDFLARLSFEPWTSPPVFDHGLLEHLVQAGYGPECSVGRHLLRDYGFRPRCRNRRRLVELGSW
jgi:hypothetical protein